MAGNPNWIKGGESPNPNGRPKKGQTYTDLLKQLGDELVDSSTGAVSRKKALMLKFWELALEGNLSAMKYVKDSIDGKPRESVQLSGSEDQEPIRVEFKFGRNGNSAGGDEPEIPNYLN